MRDIISAYILCGKLLNANSIQCLKLSRSFLEVRLDDATSSAFSSCSNPTRGLKGGGYLAVLQHQVHDKRVEALIPIGLVIITEMFLHVSMLDALKLLLMVPPRGPSLTVSPCERFPTASVPIMF